MTPLSAPPRPAFSSCCPSLPPRRYLSPPREQYRLPESRHPKPSVSPARWVLTEQTGWRGHCFNSHYRDRCWQPGCQRVPSPLLSSLLGFGSESVGQRSEQDTVNEGELWQGFEGGEGVVFISGPDGWLHPFSNISFSLSYWSCLYLRLDMKGDGGRLRENIQDCIVKQRERFSIQQK